MHVEREGSDSVKGLNVTYALIDEVTETLRSSPSTPSSTAPYCTNDIGTLAWMTPRRKRAREKLAALTKKIGYPDKCEDFSGPRVSNGPFASNVFAVRQWNSARTIARISAPTDRAAGA